VVVVVVVVVVGSEVLWGAERLGRRGNVTVFGFWRFVVVNQIVLGFQSRFLCRRMTRWSEHDDSFSCVGLAPSDR
jgi:hypothetical protein